MYQNSYPAYYQRCVLRQDKIKRMINAKKNRSVTSEKRKERLEKGISKQEQRQQEQAAAEKAAVDKQAKIEKAIAARMDEKAEELRIAAEKTAEEIDALPEDDASKDYTPIVVDPTQLNDQELQQIQNILNKKTEANSNARPEPAIVTLPDIGTGKTEYIKINPITPSDLYQP